MMVSILLFVCFFKIWLNKGHYLYIIGVLEMNGVITLLGYYYFMSDTMDTGALMLFMTMLVSEAAIAFTLLVNCLKLNGNDLVRCTV